MTANSKALDDQRGAALAVALILLVVLTLLGIAAVRVTQTELRLANNNESRAYVRQAAESLVNQVIGNGNNIPVGGGLGFKSCFVGPESNVSCAADELAEPRFCGLERPVVGSHIWGSPWFLRGANTDF